MHIKQTRIRYFCFSKLVCVSVVLSHCYINAAEHFPYQQVADCTENHYFSSSTLQCIPCGKYQVQSNDGLSCVCMAGYWHTAESVMAGGPLTCSPCPPNHVSSPDGSDCVRCQPPLRFHAQSRRCSSCPHHSITVEYGHNGSLVERACVQCDTDSVPDAVGRVCRRCPGTLRRHSDLAVTPATDSCGCSDPLLLLSVSSNAQVCAAPSLLSQIPTDVGMFTLDYGDGTVLDSHFFHEYLRPAVYLCRFHHSSSACQLLANLCTLTLYRYGSAAAGGGSSACDQLRQLRGRGVVGPAGGSALHLVPPVLYYADDEAVSVLSRTRITQQYTVLPDLQTSYMNLTVARYSWDGRLLSVSPIDGSTSAVLCPLLFSTLSSALRFGARYRRTCRVPLRRLLDSGYRTEFYQLYLYYSGTGTDQARLYSVPVRVLNYRRLDDSPNQSSDRERWQLVHRFFLADVVSGVPASSTAIDGTTGQADVRRPRIVRYVSHIQLDVEMRTDRGEPGLIYPPLLTLHYSAVNVEKEGATLNVHASAIYTSNMDKSREQIEVAVGVMSAFAAVWAVFRTWAWSNRNGKTDVDAVTLTEFVVCACGGLANVFLLVSFGTCFYWFVFFKQQSVAFLLLPAEHQQMLIRDLVIAAFFLKVVDIVWLLISQVNVDIFLMDWERPKPRAALPHPLIPAENDRTHMVSIWRTYFIANEWNEIQTLRRVSPTWRLVLTVFCLQVVGLIQLAAWTPDSRMDYSNDSTEDSSVPSPPDAYVLRFCVICLVYVTITAVQLGVGWCVLERFVSDQLQQFVDLCSLANISVLVLSSRQHGFYLHGRSVHGHADADLTTLCQQLRREQQDLCSRRGLAPNSDLQTFQILLPAAFRLHYDNILAPIISQQRRYQGLSAPLMRRMLGGGSGGGVTTGGDGVAVETPLSPSELDPSVRAYTTINKYLAAFIEHAIKDLDYSVKDKQYIETMFDLEFADSEERGIFYNDPDKSFDRVLLFGNELALSVFELLFFCFIDILSSNLLLSAFVVFCCGKMIAALRYYFGRRNLARKTLVDERFLV